MTTKFNLYYDDSASSSQPSSTPGLFSIRAVVIMLVAAIVGTGVGGLTFLAGQNAAAAILGGLTAAGLTLIFQPT